MSNDSSSTESGGFDYPLFADNPENLSNETECIGKSQGNRIRNSTKAHLKRL